MRRARSCHSILAFEEEDAILLDLGQVKIIMDDTFLVPLECFVHRKLVVQITVREN